MKFINLLFLTCLTALILDGCGGSDNSGSSPSITPSLGLTWPAATYEAESGKLSGTAAIVGASDGSDRQVGDLGGEASHRQAVVLSSSGDAVAWTVQSVQAGANALVIRYSIPDAAAGGGLSGNVNLSVQDSAGNTRTQATLQISSRYAWLYGGVMDGTKLYNVPANAATYATASTPTHLYDDIQLKLNLSLQSGDVVALTKTAGSNIASIAIDFIDLETVPAALPQPTGFLSIIDPQCGAIPLDLRQTGSVFDGADDSSYGSTFNAVLGNNPYNPSSYAMMEKDYYSNVPADTLQDNSANALAAGLSMFELADHNLQSLEQCINLVTSSGGQYTGVWIPPGRFYTRGLLQLPNGITIQGAGMWYSKFVAVDTGPPANVTNSQGQTGIAGVSGNLVFSSQSAGSNAVILSNFALFGNVTQRDTVDAVIPIGIRGEFTHSTFDNIWVEHEFIGIGTDLNSSAVKISNSRVRNTSAGGIILEGSTSSSTVENSNSRSTGDDGFAMWAQGSTAASVSQGNSINASSAQLQWYGNGFAIYGGNGASISQSSASDILNYPCLQVSTQFVPTVLPTTSTMSASATNLNFYRCGGNGFNQQYGALLIGTNLESISGLVIDTINIDSPTYKGVDMRSLASGHAVVATIGSTSVSNVEVLAAPTCATVNANTGGSAQFSNVCDCAAVNSTPAACTIANSSSGTFQINPNTCSATACPAF